MAGTSPEALAGYILEELLAYLLRNAGYRLLTDASQDPNELANRHHGLVIQGRGAQHQVDVLGELLWIPAFTFPLRLVIEAKCRRGTTDIATVRNMVAALLDINQNNVPTRPVMGQPSIPRAKYSYVGAIFSASGFSSHATDFALAHAVSLIDLRAPELQGLVTAAQQSAISLSNAYRDQERRSAGGFVRTLRNRLREALQTAESLGESESLLPADTQSNNIESAINAARQIDELFVGMASGPYMLVLKADDPRRFRAFAEEHPTHEISIHWSRTEDDGRTWSIVPRFHGRQYRLSFRLPERLAEWVFSAASARRAAAVVKDSFFSSITVYRHNPQRDQLIRLTYNPMDIADEPV